jgi:D-serine deaminase-like pyridoxal phosphate-dependent protein
MLLRNPPAPETSQREFKRLGLADTRIRIGKDSRYQVKNAERCFAIRLNPMPQILLKLA